MDQPLHQHLSIYSKLVTLGLTLFIIAAHLWINPRWQNNNTEATIGWDVAGYYLYLPATFIYKDLKQVSFKDSLRTKYGFTPDDIQGFTHGPSGNYVMKYPLGQAISYSPFFLAGHLYATNSNQYPADGYSTPYQVSISIAALIFAVIGLWLLRWVLLQYFSDRATTLTLVLIVVGSNYLNYTAIDGAMTHNMLLTWYALLLALTIKWHKAPSTGLAVGIGAVIGIMALTRPTEIIAATLPIFWGLKGLNQTHLKDHVQRLLGQKRDLAIAIASMIAIGILQPLYWQYVTGEWIVYSYEDQGFSWLKPHIIDGLFSFKSGWLTYSPAMILSLTGLYYLYHKARSTWFAIATFTALFIYIAFAWDIWWYGGALGQRTMVQTYAVLAFPIAAMWEAHRQWPSFLKGLLYTFVSFAVYLNIWFTIQAHRGGMLHVGQMTKQYYLATVGRWDKNPEHLKLLDTKHIYEGKRQNVRIIHYNTTDTIHVDRDKQFSDRQVATLAERPEWVRVSADITIDRKEWNFWKMTQLRLIWLNGDRVVGTQMIRLQRHLNDKQTRRLHIDAKPRHYKVTGVGVQLWNGDGDKPCKASNVKIETYTEN